MKWGVRKVHKRIRKAAYNQRRSVYEEEMGKINKANGNIDKSEKHMARGRKYNDKSVDQLRRSKDQDREIRQKIKSEGKNVSKHNKLASAFNEANSRQSSKTKFELDNAQNVDMAFREAGERERRKMLAASVAVPVGVTVARALLGDFGGAAATAATAASSQAVSKGAQTARDVFTVVDGQTVYVDSNGRIIKR